MLKKGIKNLGFVLAFVLVIIVISNLFAPQKSVYEPVYSDLIKDIEARRVKEIVVKDSEIEVTYKDKSRKVEKIEAPGKYILENETVQQLMAENKLKVTVPKPEEGSWLVSMLPTVITFVIIIAFWIFAFRQSQGGGKGMSGFGKSKAKSPDENGKRVTFADVAGVDEEKKELSEIVDFLRNPKLFTDLGARIPKGVLLVGPPGTGKTLLAKAVAGEAGVPFFSMSGSDFVEMFVGVGASRVRDLFEQARKNLPAIIFIDEIDAVGRQRGTGLGGGHDEREQTLNQLLVEMDGFGTNSGIIIIAATNRADILDPALLRPGRFDRQVVVNYPDQKGREAILEIHAKNKPLDETVSLEKVAKSTYGFTGADLENILNEAAILAARAQKHKIGQAEMDEAILKVVMGPEKKNKVMKDKDKEQTAYHEAGHAILSHILPTQDSVHQVSIIPRGAAGGFTLSLPDMDKMYVSKDEMLEYIIVTMGGRVAEEIIYNHINTGASSDIEHATNTARKMVMRYGMSDKLGFMNFGSSEHEVFLGRDFSQGNNYSPETAAIIDNEIKGIIDSCYARCEELLRENIDKLHAVAKALIEHEKLDGEEFVKAFDGTLEMQEHTKEEADAE
ncbi:MAG: ATP-dependent zinc metalloprotease FtsH [Clostridia bacterium]|nr:ATP-dependent zinc metalloprotease FtsH [Clostridia bacterium]